MTPDAPDGLMAAFDAYETALMSDDLEALDRLFAPGPDTLRGDAAGLLVGHDAISAFRAGRGGAPARRIVSTHVQVVDPDHALVLAVTERLSGGRGQQTQLWRRTPQGWCITAAHVSGPAPALDTRIWRLVGDPLVPSTGDGPLRGRTVAVKDLYAVAGQRIGAGNPAWEAAAASEPEHADAVTRLLAAGAAVRGISRTDEFAYSLAGTNAHYGTPPNPRAPHRISGGSSSGSASAVALGQVDIGLGTDTGGSIRVPAAYQGLCGIRTTHGAVDRTGLLPLAPSFDTVGWLTRDAGLLRSVGAVLLPDQERRPFAALVVDPTLTGLADPEVAGACAALVADWSLPQQDEEWPLGELPAWRAAFTTWQAREAWAEHGEWVSSRWDTLGADVRSRFEMASGISQEAADEARELLDGVRDRVRDLIGDRVLALPAASAVAPRLDGDLQAVREATLQLTCLAGIAGLPAVTVPTTTDGGLPCGLCLVGGVGRDHDLLELAEAVTS